MCRTQSGVVHGGVKEDPTKGRELLPANVVPTHYDLTLEPDLVNFKYDGTVIVDLDVAEDSSSISLHTLEITIHSSKITSNGELVRYVHTNAGRPLSNESVANNVQQRQRHRLHR